MKLIMGCERILWHKFSGGVRASRGGDMCVHGTVRKRGFGGYGGSDGFICIEVYRSTDLTMYLQDLQSEWK